MTHCGYFPACAFFTFYLENDNLCVDGKGSVTGDGYCEDSSWDSPGCTDYEMNYDTLEIEGYMSTKEGNFEDYEKLSLYGQEAYDFLCENGWDEEVTWGADLD